MISMSVILKSDISYRLDYKQYKGKMLINMQSFCQINSKCIYGIILIMVSLYKLFPNHLFFKEIYHFLFHLTT